MAEPENSIRASNLGLETISFGTHRYKAGFAGIAPKAKGFFEQGGHLCMLGVSLGNANFEGARLEASVEWISERFERCAVVVGDSVYRLTLQLLEGLDADAARAKALEAGVDFCRLYAPMLAQFGGKCQFEFIRFSEVEQAASFAGHLTQLQALAHDDVAFARSISDFADLYLGRGDKLDANPFAVDADAAAVIASAYLIEESALFCCLEEMGWPVLIYPGSIDSIADLCEGRFAGAPEALARLAFLSLELRKRGLYFTDGAVKILRTATGAEIVSRPDAGFLSEASDADWNTLFKFTKMKRFAPREEVLGEERDGRHLFILIDGRAEVTVKRADGTRQQIAVIESGSVFGEQAFLDAQPRSATVTALTDCNVRTLSWRDFGGLREKHPGIACDMLLDIGRVLSLRARRQLKELQFMP
jgi:tRNA-dependent cyclodipeptide synthase